MKKVAIRIQVSEDNYERLKSAGKIVGMSASQYGRFLILSQINGKENSNDNR